MKGLNILYVAAWRIFANLGVAFRLSAPWLLIMGAIFLFCFFVFLQNDGFVQFLGWLVLFIAAVFGGTCVAVGWHRFSLLGETPEQILYLPPRALIWNYIGASIKYMLVALLVAALIGVVVGLVFTIFSGVVIADNAMGYAISLLALLFASPLSVILVGMALILPAAALNKTFTLGDAFNATKANFGSLFILVIVYGVFNVLYNLLVSNLGLMQSPGVFDFGFILSLAFLIFSNWFFFVFGIGYVSELYGTLVVDIENEDRPEPSL